MDGLFFYLAWFFSKMLAIPLTVGGFGFLWVIDLFLLSGRVDYKNALFAARTAGTNNVNNVNTVQVNIGPNMLKSMQTEPAATTQGNKTDGVDLSKK